MIPSLTPNPEFPVHVELHVRLAKLPDTDLLDLCRGAVELAFAEWTDEEDPAFASWLDHERLGFAFESVSPRAMVEHLRVLGPQSLNLAAGRGAGVIRVIALDRQGARRDGLWAATVAAQAVAAALGGRVEDPDRRGLGPVDPAELKPRLDGRVHVGRHLCVPASRGGGRGTWLTTLGMRKFGFPDLEVRDVPANMIESAGRVMAGVAQHMVDLETPILRVNSGGAQPGGSSVEFTLALREVQWALGLRPTPSENGAQGWTKVSLHERRNPPGFSRLFEIRGPRHSFTRSHWIEQALRELVGPPSRAVAHAS